MAKKIKYTEKELKGPDQFTRTVISGFEYFANHTTKILVIVVGIIVVLAAAYVVNSYSAKKGERASVKFDAAVKDYDSGNYDQALDEFLTISREYRGKEISGVALYYAGIINFKLGNYNESIKNLNDFMNSGIEDSILTQSAIFTQGIAAYKQGKWQEAINYLAGLSSETEGGPYAEQAKVIIERSQEKLENPEQAASSVKDAD